MAGRAMGRGGGTQALNVTHRTRPVWHRREPQIAKSVRLAM
jgi:hypothetical protein